MYAVGGTCTRGRSTKLGREHCTKDKEDGKKREEMFARAERGIDKFYEEYNAKERTMGGNKCVNGIPSLIYRRFDNQVGELSFFTHPCFSALVFTTNPNISNVDRGFSATTATP
ncbi:unnamed protein product [Rhizoctonia solani]|uniref:Clathrin light chain n=1 Tax=Rhizoctonia solani TaxID=456999 RepID=A0A8H3DKK7_9AGAM|nr:unnamed protein product [Rhizoctonia solani]